VARREPKTTFGDYTYCDGPIRILFEESDLIVGKYCSISSAVTILLGGNHRPEWISTFPFTLGNGLPATKGDVIIGNDVWIGLHATILSGVVIGDGAVIGARSVVTKNVPPYAIVAGNPARVRKMRFTEQGRADLLRIKWWDWPHEKVLGAAHILQSGDIEKLKEIV
jgi:acetyltransferase-like isoleucine patch superfamily enzyme